MTNISLEVEKITEQEESSANVCYGRVEGIPIVATIFWQLSFPPPPVFHASIIHIRLWGFFIYFDSSQVSSILITQIH